MIITFDHIGEVITVANCHFTMYNIEYLFNMLGGSRGGLGFLIAQVLCYDVPNSGKYGQKMMDLCILSS